MRGGLSAYSHLVSLILALILSLVSGPWPQASAGDKQLPWGNLWGPSQIPLVASGQGQRALVFPEALASGEEEARVVTRPSWGWTQADSSFPQPVMDLWGRLQRRAFFQGPRAGAIMGQI